MRKPILPFLLILLSFFGQVQAQPPCAFDIKHNRLLESNPAFLKQVEENNAIILKYIEARREMKPDAAKPMATVYIPVVVHVMHTGGAVGTIYNPSDAQIIGAIDYLNQVYAGTFAGMTAPVEGGGIVDMEVQFALAQRTPSCGATNGINRVDASSLPNYTANGVNADNTNGCPELTLKDFSRWNTADYYNIWVVNKIDGADGTSGQFIAGYAYFPGSPSSLDGTIMLATQMQSGEKTLPHELGHALGLYHPFQGSANNTICPTNTNCNTQGDMVCDTDPVSRNSHPTTGAVNFSCRTGANSCASPNNYTINTENNFMAYTNCYTLFTNGQKARLQAALTLPSRTTLTDPGNMALIPCGTAINFSQAAVTQTESNTGTPDGCRVYTDYTYQMVIGSGPSAAATATLTYSGSAVKGLDYEVTTNGDFATPSDILNFAVGSTTAQSFTVRIYDDGNVETNKTIVLDFTLNNGGGDAAKGTTTPTFTLTIADNDTAPTGAVTGIFSVGTMSATAVDVPFDARLQSQRSQYLYRASELTAAGMIPGAINSLQLFINTKSSTRSFQNLSIKMANTTISNLVDGGVTVINGMTTVYTNSSLSTVAGWNLFTFSVPFNWNGNSLAFEICYDNGTADAGNAADEIGFYSDGGTASQGNLFFQAGINCSGSFSSVNYFGNGYKPVIRLGLSATGTAVESTVTATSSLYLDTPSNDYFYSNNNRLMMRLNGINAPLECVTASLEEAGTSWQNYNGGERSAKVFVVNPTTNGGTAGYTASFYFTNAELDGKNPATVRIAKTSAASVAASNPGNTLFVTPTVTTLGSGTTVFTASFTGFSRFFLVDGGVTLPIVLSKFSGTLNSSQDALLNWTTSSEYNNRGFDLEISRDGTNFSLLAPVASQGNSGSDQHYEYLHVKPQPGLNYYRLKQTDLDGHSEYSNVISLMVNSNLANATIYPVPARTHINIHFGNLSGKGEIEIFSADMKVIRKEIISDLRLIKTIAIGHLAKGIYFIRYNNGSETGVLRFIKD